MGKIIVPLLFLAFVDMRNRGFTLSLTWESDSLSAYCQVISHCCCLCVQGTVDAPYSDYGGFGQVNDTVCLLFTVVVQ